MAERMVFSARRRHSRELWSTPHDPALLPFAIDVGDGITLRGWIAPGVKGAPYVLFLYGTRGSVRKSAGLLSYLAHTTGMSAACIDYRGYGFSEGAPTFKSIREDTVRVYDRLEQKSAGTGVFVYGESLGSTFAVHVAASRPVRGLILQSPIASAREEAAWYRRYILPAPLNRMVHLVPDAAVEAGFDNMGAIAQVCAPLIIIHGDKDRVVPFEGGRRVFEAAGSSDKQFIALPGVDHKHVAPPGSPAAGAIASFLQRLAK